MIALESTLQDQVLDYIHTKNKLGELQFTLGGNWDYDHGMFDRPLDEQHTVWLRIPFRMTQGELDSEARDMEARIRIETPFVLKHLYKEGTDETAEMRTFGAFVDQFQKPADPDAGIEPHWLDEARAVLRKAESLLSG